MRCGAEERTAQFTYQSNGGAAGRLSAAVVNCGAVAADIVVVVVVVHMIGARPAHEQRHFACRGAGHMKGIGAGAVAGAGGGGHHGMRTGDAVGADRLLNTHFTADCGATYHSYCAAAAAATAVSLSGHSMCNVCVYSLSMHSAPSTCTPPHRHVASARGR